MPGALEGLDEVPAGVDGGGFTAAEAVNRLLAARIGLRNSRRLATAMQGPSWGVPFSMPESVPFSMPIDIGRRIPAGGSGRVAGSRVGTMGGGCVVCASVSGR